LQESIQLQVEFHCLKEFSSAKELVLQIENFKRKRDNREEL
ncbi:5749_t:CDS:1, partial [Scutellospora calospora]